MRERVAFLAFLVSLALASMGCNRRPAELRQIHQQRSGDYVVSLLSETGLVKQHSSDLTLEFRNASTNELKATNNVQIQATMSMPGMGPMFATLSTPRQVSAGRYDFNADFGMAGRWSFVVTFDPNQRVQFNLSAQ
jgi:YtkA-like